MRHSIFCGLFLLFPFLLDAQEDGDWSDWNEWKGELDYNDTLHERTHWAGVDLSVTGYLNPAGKFTMKGEYENWTLDYGRSIGWNLNLVETRFPIVGPYVGLVTGVGLSWHRYSFERNVSLRANPDRTWAVEDGTDYDKNKLKTTHLRVPLFFGFNTSKDPDRSFHLSFGVIGSWRFHTKFHQEFRIDGTDHSREKVAKFNVHPFRYSLSTRLGFSNYNLFFEYSPMPLFERGEGPEVYPFSAGITIVGI